MMPQHWNAEMSLQLQAKEREVIPDLSLSSIFVAQFVNLLHNGLHERAERDIAISAVTM